MSSNGVLLDGPSDSGSGSGQFACFYQRYVSTLDAIRVRGRFVKLP